MHRATYAGEYKKDSSVALSLSWRSFLVRSLFFCAIFLYVGHQLQRYVMVHLENAESMHDDLVQEQEKMLLDMHLQQEQVNMKYEALLKERQKLHDSYRAQLENSRKLSSELQQKQVNLQDERTKIQSIEQQTKHFVHKVAAEKYGDSPHFVEFTIQSRQDENQHTFYFTVELVPIHTTPISVYTFLEQVQKGLWDGTSFQSNEQEALSARPVSGNGEISRREAFEQADLDVVLFDTVSEEQQHDIYTVAINTEKPGFYISKSPRQSKDPIIGTVVIGRPVIDKLFHGERFQPIDILRAQIVQKLSEKARMEYEQVKASIQN